MSLVGGWSGARTPWRARRPRYRRRTVGDQQEDRPGIPGRRGLTVMASDARRTRGGPPDQTVLCGYSGFARSHGPGMAAASGVQAPARSTVDIAVGSGALEYLPEPTCGHFAAHHWRRTGPVAGFRRGCGGAGCSCSGERPSRLHSGQRAVRQASVVVAAVRFAVRCSPSWPATRSPAKRFPGRARDLHPGWESGVRPAATERESKMYRGGLLT
jgi:hypothetical protein